jgi:hypothetical protein
VGVSSRRRLGPGAKLVPTDAPVQELVGQGCQGAKSEDTEAPPPSAPRPASTFRADAGAGAPQRPLDAPGRPSTPTIRGKGGAAPGPTTDQHRPPSHLLPFFGRRPSAVPPGSHHQQGLALTATTVIHGCPGGAPGTELVSGPA